MGTFVAVRSPRPLPARPGPILCISSAACGDDSKFAQLLAPNLAVYLRALHDRLPLLFTSLAPGPACDDFMALQQPGCDAQSIDALPRLAAAWRSGSLNRALALGNSGVHYVRSAGSRAELAEAANPARGGRRLRDVLDRTRWSGLQLIDLRECDAGPAAAAVACADRLILPVHDLASLRRAAELLARDEHASSVGRILIAGVDRSLRVSAEGRDALHALRDEIARRRLPAYRSFLTRSAMPDIEAGLSEGRVRRSILHAAPVSALHRQFRSLAEEVSSDLGLDSVARAADPTARDVPSPIDVWRRLVLARRPRSLGSSGSLELPAHAAHLNAARPVRAVAGLLFKKGAS
jgi:hypothetical protein